MGTEFSILSTAILLMLVTDPFGNVPVILSILKDVPLAKRKAIIVRETLIGLAILVLFLFYRFLFIWMLNHLFQDQD